MLPAEINKLPWLLSEVATSTRRRFIAQVAGLTAAAALPSWVSAAQGQFPMDAQHFQLSCVPNPSTNYLTVFRAKEIAFETRASHSRPPCLDLTQYKTADDAVWEELDGIPWVTADIGLATLTPIALDWICNRIDFGGCCVRFFHIESITPSQLIQLSQSNYALFENVRTLTPAVIDVVGNQSRWVSDDGEEGAGYFSFSGDFLFDRPLAEAIARSHADLDFQVAHVESALTPEIAWLLKEHLGEYLGVGDGRSRSAITGVVHADPPRECPFNETALAVLRSSASKTIRIVAPIGLDWPWELYIQSMGNTSAS